MSVQDIAKKYRIDNSRESGVVLIWEGEVYGWKDVLRDANHERPGAIPVDVDGSVYQAQGGTDYDGAETWIQLQ